MFIRAADFILLARMDYGCENGTILGEIWQDIGVNK
jgi:hypothetical protein